MLQNSKQFLIEYFLYIYKDIKGDITMSGRGHALSTGEFTDYLPNYKCRKTRSEFAHKNNNGTTIGGAIGPTIFYDKTRTGKVGDGTFNTSEVWGSGLNVKFSVGHVSEENSVELSSTTFNVDVLAGTALGGNMQLPKTNIVTGGNVELKHKDTFASSYAGTTLSGTSGIFANNKTYFAPGTDGNTSQLQNQFSTTQAGAALGLDLYALGPRLGVSVEAGPIYEHNVSFSDGQRQVYDGYGVKLQGGIRWDISFGEGVNGGMQVKLDGGVDAALDFKDGQVNKNFGRNLNPYGQATLNFRF